MSKGREKASVRMRSAWERVRVVGKSAYSTAVVPAAGKEGSVNEIGRRVK